SFYPEVRDGDPSQEEQTIARLLDTATCVRVARTFSTSSGNACLASQAKSALTPQCVRRTFPTANLCRCHSLTGDFTPEASCRVVGNPLYLGFISTSTS